MKLDKYIQTQSNFFKLKKEKQPLSYTILKKNNIENTKINRLIEAVKKNIVSVSELEKLGFSKYFLGNYRMLAIRKCRGNL